VCGMWEVVEWAVQQQAIRVWHRTAVSTPGLRAIELCLLAPRAYDVVDICLSVLVALVLLWGLLRPSHPVVKAATIGMAWYLFDSDMSCVWEMAAKPLV